MIAVIKWTPDRVQLAILSIIGIMALWGLGSHSSKIRELEARIRDLENRK